MSKQRPKLSEYRKILKGAIIKENSRFNGKLIMLTSRSIIANEFMDDFYATILPGVIPKGEFIGWSRIDTLMSLYTYEIVELSNSLKSTPESIKVALKQYLTTSKNTMLSVQLLFRLIGHTGDVYVSLEERIDILADARHIGAKDEFSSEALARVINLLIDVGIDKVLQGNITDTLRGISVGLETHRRKNGGGNAFKNLVGIFLEECMPFLSVEYPDIELKSEFKINYSNGRQSKNVDFAYLVNGKPVIGFEVNFYTSTGSKPTEIKRSYAQVQKDLREVGTQLVWITDGEGYMKMNKSLTDAQETFPNIYNLSMLKRYIVGDILDYLKNGLDN